MDNRIHIERATAEHIPGILAYFSGLGSETRSRFAPHAFNASTLAHLLSGDSGHLAFITREGDAGPIIAYAVVRLFHEPYELDRLRGYGYLPDPSTDAYYAPSVSDAYQGKGIGRSLLETARNLMKDMGRSRILLWGGVQASNEKALAHYRKAGFKELGTFEWNGRNMDMVLHS